MSDKYLPIYYDALTQLRYLKVPTVLAIIEQREHLHTDIWEMIKTINLIEDRHEYALGTPRQRNDIKKILNTITERLSELRK